MTAKPRRFISILSVGTPAIILYSVSLNLTERRTRGVN